MFLNSRKLSAAHIHSRSNESFHACSVVVVVVIVDGICSLHLNY